MRRGRIFFISYGGLRPTGGVKVSYHHAEILDRRGIEATVVQVREATPIDWFDHTSAPISLSEFFDRFDPARDLMVLPEDFLPHEMASKLLDYPGRKVIFNQNVYLGFEHIDRDKRARDLYAHPDVKAAVTVSEDNRRFLSFAYPRLAVRRVRLGVAPHRFAFRPVESKRRLIVCAAKAHAASMSIYHALASRAESGENRLAGYDWVFPRSLTEQEIAALLGDALMFVFLNIEEGLGLFPIEAMASGCIPIAFGVGPLKEYLPPALSKLRPGDMVRVARAVERIARWFEDRPRRLAPLTRACRRAALRFSPAREEESVVETWSALLDGR